MNTKILLNTAYTAGKIDPRLYGSFLEHMGRVVYGGVYEPSHPLADEDGFRQDVLDAVKNAGITQVRYPGGNFVSCYHWEDGIGPKRDRPHCLELAWRAIETNEFGTDEFFRWAKKAEITPMLAVNLGSRGIEDAVHYLEYCNFPKGTKYSDLRRKNGREEPYNVKMWCLGNEMDGSWQIGHKTAEEYGRLAAETAKVMKIIDPAVELSVCGSSLNTMETFPQWEETVLEHTYEYVDYISLHQYFAGQEKGTKSFLAQADEMDRYIKDVVSACDFVRAKKRSDHKINISFDEWGVWAYRAQEVAKQCKTNSWELAPEISEMIYTFEDSLLFGGMLLALLKNADRVKIACQSLLTNVSAMIMTEKNGGIWYQPIYYPFTHVANHGKGVVLDCRIIEGEKEDLDYAAVYNEPDSELVIFAINRDDAKKKYISLEMQGLECRQIIEHVVMESEDPKAVNSLNHIGVKPHRNGKTEKTGKKADIELPELSWNMIRIEVQKSGLL